MQYFEVGDTNQFNKAVRDQLTTDLKEARIEFTDAVKSETKVKEKYQRRLALRTIAPAQQSNADKLLMEKPVSKWKKRLRKKINARKQARKDYEEAHKALDSFKDEEQRGHVRENDIQKQGSQFKTKWTHLPE